MLFLVNGYVYTYDSNSFRILSYWTAYTFEEGDGTVEVYAGNDFQLDFSTVCVLATVNNIFSGCGSCFRVQRVSQQSLDDRLSKAETKLCKHSTVTQDCSGGMR